MKDRFLLTKLVASLNRPKLVGATLDVPTKRPELLDAEEIEEIINNADGKHHLLVRFYHDNKNDVGIMKLSTQGTPRQ